MLRSFTQTKFYAGDDVHEPVMPGALRYSHMTRRRWWMKTRKKRSAGNTRFRPGTTGACEAQLWTFIGSPGILHDDNDPQVHWVAAESLEAALRYMRLRHDDSMIREARFLGMIPLLSGSPLD